MKEGAGVEGRVGAGSQHFIVPEIGGGKMTCYARCVLWCGSDGCVESMADHAGRRLSHSRAGLTFDMDREGVQVESVRQSWSEEK